MRFALAFAVLLSPSAFAANDSAYTMIAGEGAHCTTLKSNPDEGGSYLQRCAGHSGTAVFVAEGDLRTFVSYGWNAQAEIAASETFPFFNGVGDTVEWRLRDGSPVATILRWKIDGGDGLPKGEVLVVTQLQEGNQCWIAQISATMNPDANMLARQAADELAGNFRCGDEMPRIYGTPDYNVMAIE
jgi:hypothetical protein